MFIFCSHLFGINILSLHKIFILWLKKIHFLNSLIHQNIVSKSVLLSSLKRWNECSCTLFQKQENYVTKVKNQ